MIRKEYFKLLFLVLFCCSTTMMAQNYEKTEFGVKATIHSTDIEVQFINPATVRVLKSPSQKKFIKESLSVIEKPQPIKLSLVKKENYLRLQSEKVKIDINLSSGILSFLDKNNIPLLRENKAPVFTDFNDAGVESFKVKQSFSLAQDEAIYGLGVLQNEKMNQRNQTKYLIQGNVEDGIPFFQSIKGYGLFWDNYSPTNFADNQNETFFESEVGDCIDYYFMYGGDADGVIAQMRKLTGEVPMLPLWTYGYWQSRERYKTQDELLTVVRNHRKLGVPLDGIIQDWQYWGNNYLWNAMEFLNSGFYNAQGMIDEVHDLNAHIIISIWSSFGPMTKPYRDLDEKGLLFNIKTWPMAGTDSWPPNLDYPSGVRVYDAYSPVARTIYWEHLTRLYDMNIDGWWMDSTEPDHFDATEEDMQTQTYLGSFRKVRNAYPLMTVGGVYKNQRAVTSDKRVFILTRSGFAGQQRYGANVWSGDVGSTWDALRKQIPAGLNFTLTGNPNFNTDIGGFFAGHYNNSWNEEGLATKNPQFQELYVRWMQYGAFSPMMRSHGTDVPREIYYFGKEGEPVFDALKKAIELRYSLLPYIYSTSWLVSRYQSSFMRALMMDFTKDKKVWDINNQYMFGKSILVAPILEAQYTPEAVVDIHAESGWDKKETLKKEGKLVTDFTKKKSTTVYLPEGVTWYDFWTNQSFHGGQEIKRESTLDLIPLYVKSGSIIPIGPKVQYAEEKNWDHLELRVYAGENGTFTLYEDEFDNYNYQKGAYTEIPIAWNDKAKKLTIGDRIGSYDGMLKTRQFTVILQNGEKKIVDYSGKKVSVRF